jgi:hypothetical protein
LSQTIRFKYQLSRLVAGSALQLGMQEVLGGLRADVSESVKEARSQVQSLGQRTREAVDEDDKGNAVKPQNSVFHFGIAPRSLLVII